ncbi:hypothetical protein AVI51_03010 [Piscirickettsia salmonis]|uniref:Uncharacterized protein n=1 Tax=Piscirickettsia salmonis TaxID=1238 RepID=A0A095BNY1_PISSA|nr:hypothetical protein [Piscirickettsia salmonis]RNC77947.1 hypothetical protein DA717_07395 [Piscirickettsiaceae bacterium NZ-RLO2]AKP73952.1 hypothetical protein PSLF89_2214 [Piscirickettsia salmonis LF-89 = ATCC VR-1361]ALA25038.1 hypothetical protein KW89_1572 [Piscirickettsia salmonis]ALB22784.1 hypothetical protein KU39_1602 [Piscirickettsia salmonis]ALY02773.1 hypothetical protein AWE47_07850 [Piscirickettsia salmonis]
MHRRELNQAFDRSFALLIEEENCQHITDLLEQLCCDHHDLLIETKYDDVEVCFKYQAQENYIEMVVYQDKVLLEDYHIAIEKVCEKQKIEELHHMCHLIRKTLNDLPLHKNKPCLPD